MLYRVTDMTVPEVCGTQKRDVKFCTDGYQAPYFDHRHFFRKKNETDLRKTLGYSKNLEKRIHFTDAHAQTFIRFPGPAHKRMPIRQDITHEIPLKTGIFLKNKRATFTEEMMKASKLIPAPSKYPVGKYGDKSAQLKEKLIGNMKW